MKLPGLVGYHETLAEYYVNYKIRCREEREAERERTKPGPVTHYVPYAGIYKMLNDGGALLGYADREPMGEWQPAIPRSLIAALPPERAPIGPRLLGHLNAS